MSYRYTAEDIAQFLLSSNMRLSEQQQVVRSIWEQDKNSIPIGHRADFGVFKRSVEFELDKLSGLLGRLDELKVILKDLSDIKIDFPTIYEQNIIERYFKLIRLDLCYSDSKKSYRKIKLRRLLKTFNYKRRSQVLVKYIGDTLNRLDLELYVKGKERCRIADVTIHEMLVIRLRETLPWTEFEECLDLSAATRVEKSWSKESVLAPS